MIDSKCKDDFKKEMIKHKIVHRVQFEHLLETCHEKALRGLSCEKRAETGDPRVSLRYMSTVVFLRIVNGQ